MKSEKRDDWPGIPAGLKYVDLRLPGTFRELVANENFTDEQIGRIIRCLALDTDFFISHDIEAEVMYYRQCLVTRNNTRMRVQAFRKRRKDGAAGVLSAAMVNPNVGSGEKEVAVTVTGCCDGASSDSFSSQKTPSDLKEKHPPIVPPKKKAPISLEKTGRRDRRESVADGIQTDLFSAALGGGDHGRIPGSPEMGSKSVQDCEETSGGKVAHQDIGNAPACDMATSTGECHADSRNEAAWIPSRFAMFWSKYPKKVAKADAMKAFTKLIKTQPDVDKFMSILMASLEWWKRQTSWVKDGGKFVPHPATWLNRGNWEDSNENSVVSGTTGDAKYLSMDNESTEDLLRRMRGG